MFPTTCRKLYLAGNRLVGPIPSSLGDIATLSDLSLAGNELSGPIPDSFGNLTLLRYLRYDPTRLLSTLEQLEVEREVPAFKLAMLLL